MGKSPLCKKVVFWWKILISFDFYFLKCVRVSCKLCDIDCSLECKENILQLTQLLRAEDWARNFGAKATILLNYGLYVSLTMSKYLGQSGVVPNKGVLMFVSMLRASFVCDRFMPLWFLENVSTIVCQYLITFRKYLDMIEISTCLTVFVDLTYHSRYCCF